MLVVITFILSVVFILIDWGFLPALVALLGPFVLDVIAKPRYRWQVNWRPAIWVLAVQISGVCAVNGIWHEPVYNVVAVVLVILSYVV